MKAAKCVDDYNEVLTNTRGRNNSAEDDVGIGFTPRHSVGSERQRFFEKSNIPRSKTSKPSYYNKNLYVLSGAYEDSSSELSSQIGVKVSPQRKRSTWTRCCESRCCKVSTFLFVCITTGAIATATVFLYKGYKEVSSSNVGKKINFHRYHSHDKLNNLVLIT